MNIISGIASYFNPVQSKTIAGAVATAVAGKSVGNVVDAIADNIEIFDSKGNLSSNDSKGKHIDISV